MDVEEMRNQDGFFGLFFAPLPNLEEELTAVKATIQTEKEDEISAIQPMCCRELIFTEPRVLVSPLLEERNKLFLITQKVILYSSQFQELLQKLNIQETEPVDLTKSLFQFCFSFTMKQKLAPLWNKAGEFLVQGRDFMQEKSKLNAVSLEVTISDRICIGLQAYYLKSTPCKPEHFTASTRALEEFSTNNKAVITDAAISDDLCFVLPSLKKGRIFSITHHLPEECPFASYEDLRKHWKLMYGYRLPTEENVFYNVHFYYIRGKVFTYPASCIRSSQALVSSRCDHQLIFNTFLRDVSVRMPSICGTPLALTSSPLYQTSKLQQATHANHSNLTRTEPQLNHCRPFAIKEQLTPDSVRQTNASLSISRLQQATHTSHSNLTRTAPQLNHCRRTPDSVRQTNASPSVSCLLSQPTSSQIYQTGSDKTITQLTTTPSVNQLSTTLSVNQLKTTPSVNQLSITPSVNQLRTTPSVNQLRTTPSVNQLKTTPSVNQLSITPSVNQLRTTPSVNQLSITPPVNQLRTTPSVNQLCIAPPVNQLRTTPSVNQLSIAPPVNQLRTTPFVNQLSITPSVNQLRTTPPVNQSRTAPSGTPWFSCLSLEARFVPRFTGKRVMNSDRERSLSCNSDCSSSSITRIVPTFTKKRVQSRGNKPTSKSQPTATKAASRVCLVGYAVQTQNATSSASSQPSPRIIRQVHTQSQKRSSQILENNLMERVIGGTMQGDHSSEISSSFNQELMTDSILTNSPAAIPRQGTPVAHSASSSTRVSKCLPQSRPGLVITQSAPAIDHLPAPFTVNMTQGPREDPVNLTQHRSNWGVTPASGLSISGLDRERTTSVHQLQHEPFPVQFQSRADLTKKRQINGVPHEDPPHKKPKSKPKIQDNIDVRELALQDQLHKVNAVTLADWLKKRGVAVKSKDKKAELASKVLQYLAVVPHEQ